MDDGARVSSLVFVIESRRIRTAPWRPWRAYFWAAPKAAAAVSTLSRGKSSAGVSSALIHDQAAASAADASEGAPHDAPRSCNCRK